MTYRLCDVDLRASYGAPDSGSITVEHTKGDIWLTIEHAEGTTTAKLTTAQADALREEMTLRLREGGADAR